MPQPSGQIAGFLSLFLLFALAALGAGCNSACPAILQTSQLPGGWSLIPSEDMATDKMPWWKENPISLRGSQVKQVEVDGKPSLASEFRAAAYEHDDSGDEVIIFCLTYQQRDDALDEMRRFNNELPKTDLVGFSRASDRVIVILSAPEDCPDREFFVGHFATVAVPAQTGATPAAVRE